MAKEMMKDLTVCYDDFPTLIRACAFNDGWEFGGPTIIYYPFFKYGESELGELYTMVEDVCIDLSIHGSVDFKSFRKELEDQCAWRGWSLRGFAKRKRADHEEYAIRWYNEGGETHFEVTDIRQQEGPFTEGNG